MQRFWRIVSSTSQVASYLPAGRGVIDREADGSCFVADLFEVFGQCPRLGPIARLIDSFQGNDVTGQYRQLAVAFSAVNITIQGLAKRSGPMLLLANPIRLPFLSS